MTEFNAKKTTDELIEWIQDTVGNCNTVIGISGGKDSTIGAMLATLALGRDRVWGIMIPDGKQKDIEDSKRVCRLLGIHNRIVNIGAITSALRDAFNEAYIVDSKREKFNDVYETNTPARIRMTTLYGVAAIIGNARVMNTCNGPEDYVGYATKFGDSAGDYSPLANLTIKEVLAVGVECAKRLDIYEEIEDLIFKTPDDGMSNKSDEEKLGFAYAVLDDYIRLGVCEDLKTKEIIDKMHVANLHKLKPMPKFVPEEFGPIKL